MEGPCRHVHENATDKGPASRRALSLFRTQPGSRECDPRVFINTATRAWLQRREASRGEAESAPRGWRSRRQHRPVSESTVFSNTQAKTGGWAGGQDVKR